MRDEENMEAEIQAKGLNAPRLTPALLDSKIVSAAYYVFPGTTLTICALTLVNGFQVTGESAAASLENFDQAIGEKISYGNARAKIWALEGYLLRERLAFPFPGHHVDHAYRDSGSGEFTTKADAQARPGETQRDTFIQTGKLVGARRSSEVVTKDISNDCWRNAKGDEVPANEVVREGDIHVRLILDTDLGGVSGKVLGHDRSEEGDPSFKG